MTFSLEAQFTLNQQDIKNLREIGQSGKTFGFISRGRLMDLKLIRSRLPNQTTNYCADYRRTKLGRLVLDSIDAGFVVKGKANLSFWAKCPKFSLR